jgi:hypothetical protein
LKFQLALRAEALNPEFTKESRAHLNCSDFLDCQEAE